jgi:AAA domain
MSVQFRPARRENVPLLLSVAGGTGSGKTYSAMRLAKGITPEDERFAVIDTENGRARHYADQFDFDVADLEAPFNPARYQEAILAAAAAGYKTIVVDSMSHEHAGDGGLLDMQEAELARMAGQDAKKRETMNMAAWVQPKGEHKKLVTALLQIKAHVIVCFRAAEKIEIARDERGKMVVRPKQSLVGLDGWVPIAEKNLPYEMVLSVLFTADAPGVPKPIKLEDQHRPMVPLDKPITEDVGRRLAAWAAGAPEPDSAEIADLKLKLLAAAEVLGVTDVTEKWLKEPRVASTIRRQITMINNRIDAAAETAAAEAAQGQLETPVS